VGKNKISLWLVITFMTILPVGLDRILFLHNFNFPIIWTIYILPGALITIFYPSWKVVITSGIIFSLIKYTVVIIGHRWWDIFGILMHIGSSMLSWMIILTLAYFRINYEKLLQEVNRKALTDPLTKIYNRRYFDQYLNEAVSLSDNPSLTLNLLDIDFFKRVNDTYGHVCGDLALQHVTMIIKNNVRESDVLARLGGEEFAVIFSETSLEEGKKICERIREAIEKTEFIYKNQPIYLTISIGMSQHHGETVYEFIDKADKALFEAKERGRNQVVVA
jgi:diguanylate cyclase (GGDEF)-like protein